MIRCGHFINTQTILTNTKRAILPFNKKIQNLFRRCEGPVRGQEDVDVGWLQLSSVRSCQTFDKFLQTSGFDESDPNCLPFQMRYTVVIWVWVLLQKI